MQHNSYDLDFTYAFSKPGWQAVFKGCPEDFQVTELFSKAQFSGDGEHLCLSIEKRDENTRWVAKLLAEAFSVEEFSIGYCGLKDRRAVTRQWFSIHLPGRADMDISGLAGQLGENIRVLDQARHYKKIRQGDHQGNHFNITLRQLETIEKQGDSCKARVEERIEQLSTIGAPNYFGEQRFGKEGGNLTEAAQLLSRINEQHLHGDRTQKRRKRKKPSRLQGIYLSAARSYLFNRVLSERVANEGVNCLINDQTGPLWGRGRSPVDEPQRELEAQLLAEHADWLEALEHTGMSQERRSLVMQPQQLSFSFQNGDLRLNFSLPKGQYATSLLRELCVFAPLQIER